MLLGLLVCTGIYLDFIKILFNLILILYYFISGLYLIFCVFWIIFFSLDCKDWMYKVL